MSYKLVDDPHIPSYKILQRDTQIVNCPHHPPMVIQGKLQGQMSMQYKGCGTWCALFRIHNNVVQQTCTGMDNVITIPKESSDIVPAN